MHRQAVQSTALRSVGYDAKKKILELEFKENSGVWQYFGISPATYKRLMNAASLGHYFVTRIKGKYPELRII
ncbi:MULTISPECIES: KTSC domain-containing protein [unclassified Mucilaginibacter]|uniref:KTSC domain-containing protein n=1 Tax=unclassified Mucilaginibacter TaxID=2617802 RepID=UPI00095B6B0F|nr:MULTISPECIES: KTSC domain-containing protein [unclassified Mucilaginibacter]OJW13776.1 MAG: hypothetical protein BGO48_03365 [Mucilaginibacter sp. 44-25]PLW91479.1 MAG: KTSC domain-containing protein [Mucilaginibacter sp.]HEK21457.1 KTSC domain-containing protein [Bacteroidota bacterium]